MSRRLYPSSILTQFSTGQCDSIGNEAKLKNFLFIGNFAVGGKHIFKPFAVQLIGEHSLALYKTEALRVVFGTTPALATDLLRFLGDSSLEEISQESESESESQ
jgi:hypothetical protein